MNTQRIVELLCLMLIGGFAEAIVQTIFKYAKYTNLKNNTHLYQYLLMKGVWNGFLEGCITGGFIYILVNLF